MLTAGKQDKFFKIDGDCGFGYRVVGKLPHFKGMTWQRMRENLTTDLRSIDAYLGASDYE